MFGTILKIVLVCIITIVLLYISRFWPVELWARRGSMLSDLGLRPQGGLLRIWLRGTGFTAFELVIWSVLAFVTLSLLEKLNGRLGPSD
jgi:hypothetical protein